MILLIRPVAPRTDDVPRGFSVPLIPVVAGSYEAMPSVIYPYYEPQREAYAAPLKVRIDAAYDVAAGMLKLEADGRRRRLPTGWAAIPGIQEKPRCGRWCWSRRSGGW